MYQISDLTRKESINLLSVLKMKYQKERSAIKPEYLSERYADRHISDLNLYDRKIKMVDSVIRNLVHAEKIND